MSAKLWEEQQLKTRPTKVLSFELVNNQHNKGHCRKRQRVAKNAKVEKTVDSNLLIIQMHSSVAGGWMPFGRNATHCKIS